MRVPDLGVVAADQDEGVLGADGIGDAMSTVLETLHTAFGTPLGQWSAAFTATVLVACVVWERIERGRARPADPTDTAGGTAWFWNGLTDTRQPVSRPRRPSATPS